ncbi:hypothetical protein ACFO1B_51870 [Dactylosporangium siamense]|uniref:Uncharacterized protein n=1 Tax=Dactylosporangium siamense TaxID=685454 RepID=A0A919UAI5_9ACTN|nr:hypothetical protein [Dactylosporangium siamense]GIG43678.1 hypothetical protein Dsi01nite_017190 [Dactylosporangium siamense]
MPLRSVYLIVAALVLALLPSTAAHANGAPYTGKQYDYGGAITQISGSVQTVDDVADSIKTSTAATVNQIAAQRATLPYGDIYPAAGTPAQLTTYPGPPAMAASNQYSATVQQSGGQISSYVYKILARKTDTNRELDTSWTSFSFAGSVTVRVTRNAPGATGCLVRPYSANVVTSFSGSTCTFTLTEPGNLSVEFLPDIHNPILHPMLVFANPPEVDVPSASDPNVRYFAPGIHNVGAGQPITSGQTIYLAGGAFVSGAFIATGPVSNVTIKGRGVMSGLFMDTGNQDLNKDQPGMIDIADQGSTNLLVEGITFVDAPRFNVRALAQYTTIHNVKTMSWWYSTDGMVGGNKSLLENNFVKSNDDSIKLFWGDTTARGNTIWQLENGAPFMISWNIHVNPQTFNVYDNDVIHAEHYQIEKSGIFRALHAGSGTLSRYLFDDIRVENATWRLFYLAIEDNKWYDPALGHGEIEQVIFRNIYAHTTYTKPNLVQGYDANHKLRNINFQNVYANGVCFNNVQAGNFTVDPVTTNAIRIYRSTDGSCRT